MRRRIIAGSGNKRIVSWPQEVILRSLWPKNAKRIKMSLVTTVIKKVTIPINVWS